MRPQELALLYIVAALITGVALHRRGRTDWLSALLWPLAVPSLLAPPDDRFETTTALPETPQDTTPTGPIERLQRALDLLDVGSDVSALGRGIQDLAGRLDALTALLAEPGLRDANRGALETLRARLVTEQEAALDRIDDLVTTIHLAHYGGRPPEHLEEQLADLLAMIEGVAEVQWIP